jgi:hypothetical protein
MYYQRIWRCWGMNREIRFRGKTLYDRYDHYASPEPDTKEGTWVYGDLMTEYPYHKGLTIVENGVYHEVDPETVGQYTGLKDKNGVKIYEGDVVKGYYYINGVKKRIVGRVMFGYNGWNISGVGHYVGDTITLTSACEVIGMIHDNPELLEVLGDD